MSDTRKRGIVCCFCGEAWGYEGDNPNDDLIKLAFTHESECKSNPYLSKINELKLERDELRERLENEIIAKNVLAVNCNESECERERDELRAEVERLKGRVVELTELLVSAENREEAQKRQAHSNYADYREALAEVERLKAERDAIADAAHSAINYVGAANYEERIRKAHESIDSAMKGDA